MRGSLRGQVAGFLRMGQGFFGLVLADQGEGQMIMWPGRVRVEPQSFGELVCGFARVVQFQEGKPQVVVGLGLFGLSRKAAESERRLRPVCPVASGRRRGCRGPHHSPG